VFRIFQELLTNVSRHAQANNVLVRLTVNQERLQLQVMDDGVGIASDSARSYTSLGLLGMKERAMAHNGTIQIDSSVDKGTSVTAIIPLPTSSETPL